MGEGSGGGDGTGGTEGAGGTVTAPRTTFLVTPPTAALRAPETGCVAACRSVVFADPTREGGAATRVTVTGAMGGLAT